MRTPSVRLLALPAIAARDIELLARDMVSRDRGRKLRQVLRSLVCDGLEPRGERNQLSLAEGRAEEGDAHRNAEDVRRRHLDIRIAARSPETRAAEHEVISVQQIRRPCRTVGRCDYSVEVKHTQRLIDTKDREVLVGRERRVVGKTRARSTAS